MTDSHLTTKFAPAERAPQSTIAAQAQVVQATERIAECFDAVNDIAVVLNPQRQIVFANQRFVELLGLTDRDALYGQRPGEALDCVHAALETSGCGTSENCCHCGAVNAIMIASLLGHGDIERCTIDQTGGDTLNLLVRTTPIAIDGETFVVSALTPLPSASDEEL
jgi:PAS domain-containing protein